MKLRLKGFKGIAAGPQLTWDGLREIEVDFAGRNGLVAFAGENGGGKSTLLENLHHYPQLVSRDGALWQHVIGRNAEKEFISTFMGREYRSLIKMDADQGKQEGYLWRDGVPMVNGKISAYKEAVNEIFGQPFTYFRSQFCPQKSKATRDMQLENLTVGVFRELLREFLNLQKYSVYEDTAKQAANIYQGKAGQLDMRVNVLQENISVKAMKEVERCAAGDKAGFLQDDKALLEHELSEKRGQIDALKETISKNVLALERKKDLTAQIERLQVEMGEEKTAAETEIGALSAKYREIKLDIDKQHFPAPLKESIEAAAETMAGLESGLTGLMAQIEEENQNVPVYQKRCHDLETALAQLRQQVKDLENDPAIGALVKGIEEGKRRAAELAREIHDLEHDREVTRVLSRIETAMEKTTALDLKDPACQSTACSFIVAALEAQEALPGLNQELEARKKVVEGEIAERRAFMESLNDARESDEKKRADLIEKLGVTVSEVEGQISRTKHDLGNAQQALLSTNELLTMHRQDLTTKRAEIVKQKALADRLPDIRIAEQRKADLEKQLQEVMEQGTAKKKVWMKKETEIHVEIATVMRSRNEITVDESAETKLQAVQWDIKEIETTKLPALETEIQAARNKVAGLETELSRIAEAETELVEVKTQRELLTRNMSSWRYLQLGCGKNGLQNLRIDAAAPRIVYNANRLLSQAYGALYSIRLETINEAGKEDLQVKVIMENGQEVYLDDISGGQRAWVVQALWLAMSMLNQEKSGKQFDYFCSDESDGPLDQDNAEKYTALYRPFMESANLQQIIFISHKESCRAMADHILSFSHGKNPQWT